MPVRDLEQIIEPVAYDFGPNLTRRGFVQILGAGILIAASSGTVVAQDRQRRGGRGGGGEIGGGAPVNLDARLHIGKDGTITVLAGKVEGGQGARAELTQAAAEELRVPIEQVRLILADTALVPNDGITAGSRTTPATVPAVRNACAAARKLLEDFISHSPAAKKLTYADLASDEKFIAAQLEHSELMYQQFVNHFRVKGFRLREPATRLMVAVFSSHDGLEAYVGQPTPALMTGIYHPLSNRLVVYDFGRNRALVAAQHRQRHHCAHRHVMEHAPDRFQGTGRRESLLRKPRIHSHVHPEQTHVSPALALTRDR